MNNITQPNNASNVAPAPETLEKKFPYNVALKTLDDELVNSAKVLSSKKKRPVLLSFWLTTCAPCRRELAIYNTQYADWKKELNFELYAISIDFEQNYPNVIKMAKEANWPFPVYYDFNRSFRDIMPGELNGLPQIFIISPDGEIFYHKKGFTPGDEAGIFKSLRNCPW